MTFFLILVSKARLSSSSIAHFNKYFLFLLGLMAVIMIFSLTMHSAYADHAPPEPIKSGSGVVERSLVLAFLIVLGLTMIAHWTITRIRLSSYPTLTPAAVAALQNSRWKFWNVIRADDWFPSLSLFQFLMWTLIILFVYLSITFIRSSVGAAAVVIDEQNLYILMGISVTSPVVAGAMSQIKYRSASAPGSPPSPLPAYSTMLQEGGKPSLTRFQMFAWTFVGILVFLIHFSTAIMENVGDVNHLNIPVVDNFLVVLMGISQTAYLGVKGVTPTQHKHRLFPEQGAAGTKISIFGDGLDFGPTTDTVWFGTTRVTGAAITNWKPTRIDLAVPAGLDAGTVYEVRVAHSGLLTYVGNFTAG
jgi:hypothetical protein